MIIFLTGFAAGLVHVLTGPDHLAAVAPLSLNSKKSNWLIGFKWGIGHTGGVFVVAIIALLFRELIPINLLSNYSERFVGVVLIGIGLWGIKKVLFKNIHVHEHKHDGSKHVHIHAHESLEEHNNTEAHNHSHAAFGVGIIHGFAGSSHLLGILPALALPTRLQAVTYLLAFGAGTISAMVVFSIIMGSLADRFSFFGIKAYRGLLITFSVAAIVIGGFWLFI